MSGLIETILFVFGLVALGYLAGLTRYLKDGSGDALAEFAVNLALPLLLFRTMVEADFHGAAPWAFWGTYFAAVVVTWIAGHLMMTRVFGRDSSVGVVGGVSSAFSNIVLLGIPFILGVFGQEGFEILSLLIAVHLPTMMIASTVLFQIFGRDRTVAVQIGDLAIGFFRKIFSNPLIIGIACGVLWRLTGIPLPSLAARFVDAFAVIAAPLALFAMGLGLRRFGISGNIRAGIALASLKLMLMPAAALCIALIVGLPPMTAKVAVVVAALPSGVNSYLIATQFGTGQALASNAMIIATAVAAVTTGLWLYLATMLFG